MNSLPRHCYPISSPVIGHRGASGYAPENTAAAIKLAKQLGCQWIEVDVAISRDQVPIIFHDAELDRCTTGTGLVALQDWLTLQKLDAGSWYDKEFQDERILSLEKLLDIAQQCSLKVNLEIKPTIGLERETVSAIASLLNQRPTCPELLLSSFSSLSLQHAQLLLDRHPRALNVEAIPQDWRERLREINACGLHFASEFVEPNIIAAIAAEYGVSCYTVNSNTQAKELLNMGVDAVFTDYPDQIY